MGGREGKIVRRKKKKKKDNKSWGEGQEKESEFRI